MQSFIDILTLTVPSASTWEAYDLVSPAGAKVTGADAAVLGVAKHPNTVVGDAAAVMVIGVAREGIDLGHDAVLFGEGWDVDFCRLYLLGGYMRNTVTAAGVKRIASNFKTG